MASPTKIDPQREAVVKRLDTLVERSPDLAETAAFYRAALPLLREAQAAIAPLALEPETARRKLELGQPLLVGEDLPLDVEAGRELFLRLCRVLEKVIPDSSKSGAGAKPSRRAWTLFTRGQPVPLKLMERAQNGDGAALRSAAARQLRRAVEQNELDLVSVWPALAMGDWRRVEVTAAGLQLDADLLRMLAQTSLKPTLRAWAQQLKNKVDLDDWRRGQCPVCGSPPALSEIQGKEGARRLRCAMCGSDWHYPRLQCAFCANKDYKSLGYISVEGEEEKYRLQTCDVCGGYLKVVVTYDPTPVDLLAVEDLATLHLDLIAAERDYVRVPVR